MTTYDSKSLTRYRNLVKTAKSLGFVHKSKGKPYMDDLEKFVHLNIEKDPIPEKVKRKYDSSYINELFILAVENGYINERCGKKSANELIEYLVSRNIELPENTVVIHQHRKKLSECKTRYARLLFQAKELGYKQKGLGRPSLKTLENYLQC